MVKDAFTLWVCKQNSGAGRLSWGVRPKERPTCWFQPHAPARCPPPGLSNPTFLSSQPSVKWGGIFIPFHRFVTEAQRGLAAFRCHGQVLSQFLVLTRQPPRQAVAWPGVTITRLQAFPQGSLVCCTLLASSTENRQPVTTSQTWRRAPGSCSFPPASTPSRFLKA